MTAAAATPPQPAPADDRRVFDAAPFTWQAGPPFTASLPRRALAFTLDAIIVFALAWTITFATATAGILRIPDIDVLGQRSPAAGLLWIVSIFELPLLLGYFTVFEAVTSRTPGKTLLGLRVAKLDGERLGLFDAFIRGLLRLLWVTPLGPAFVVLDYWSLRTTELDQRIGDLTVGTIVLDERARERLAPRT